MDGTDLLKTGDVARLLGVSRQHVVDLCDRGDISCIWIGSHRRVPRSEASRLQGSLTREEERSLWLHHAVVGELVKRPTQVLQTARRNLDRWRSIHRPDGMAVRYLERWSELIDSGLDAVLETATSRSPESRELRQNSPFAGVLADRARAQVLRAFDEHWSHTHQIAS